jgi:hypothetical protein
MGDIINDYSCQRIWSFPSSFDRTIQNIEKKNADIGYLSHNLEISKNPDAGGVDERLTDNRLFTYHSSVGR